MAEFNKAVQAWDQQRVALYLGWQDFENSLPKEERYECVVDDYVGPPIEPTPINSRRGIKSKLINHYNAIPSDHPYLDFEEQCGEGSLAVIDDLEGQPSDFTDLVARTIHVSVKEVRPKIIRDQRQAVAGLLSHYDIPFTPEGLAAYKKQFVIKDPEEIKQKFIETVELDRTATRGIVSAPKEVNVDTMHEDTAVEAWAGTKDGVFTTIINTHPRIMHTAGTLAGLGFHEVSGHGSHIKAVREATHEGRLLPSAGLFTVHDPGVVQAEAIAHAAVTGFLKSPASPGANREYDLASALYTYSTMTWNNIHIAVNSGVEPEKAAEQAAKLMPFKSAEELVEPLTKRRDNLAHRCYFAADWPALQLVRRSARLAMRGKENQRAIFEELMSRPLTYQNLQRALAVPVS